MNRGLNMLGLCARAGKLISGEKNCVQSIRSHSVYAAVMDRAAAKNAVKSVTDACNTHKIPLVYAPENELGDAIGKPGRMVVGITDEGFAKRVIQLMEQP